MTNLFKKLFLGLTLTISLILHNILSIEDSFAERLQIVTTIEPLKYIIEEIIPFGERDVTSLVPDNISPHHMHLKPSQIRAIRNADLVFYIDNRTFETFLNKFLKQVQPRQVQKFHSVLPYIGHIVKMDQKPNHDGHDKHHGHNKHDGHDKHHGYQKHNQYQHHQHHSKKHIDHEKNYAEYHDQHDYSYHSSKKSKYKSTEKSINPHLMPKELFRNMNYTKKDDNSHFHKANYVTTNWEKYDDRNNFNIENDYNNNYALPKKLRPKMNSYYDINSLYDPHIWLCANNMIDIAKYVLSVLVKHDLRNKEVYIENTRNLIRNLRQLDEEIKEKFKPLQDQKILTFHGTYEYMFQHYGLKNGRSLNQLLNISGDHIDITPKRLKKLIQLIKRNNIQTIYIDKNDFAGKELADRIREKDRKLRFLYVRELAPLDLTFSYDSMLHEIADDMVFYSSDYSY